MNPKTVFLLLCFLHTLVFKGYAEGFNFIHYNTNNSALPHDICYRMLQDKQGYLWITTDDGLVRFDGRDMKVYQKGFRNRFVIAAAAYDTTFLISTWKGGVHRLYNDSIIPLPRTSPADANFTSSNNILLFKELMLLFYFDQVSAYKYDYVRNRSSPSVLQFREAGKADTQIAFSRDYKFTMINDSIVAYNRNGISRFDGAVFNKVAGHAFQHLVQGPDKAVYGLKGDSIYKLSRDLRTCHPYQHIPANINLQNRHIERFYMLSSGNVILQLSDYPHQPSFSSGGKYLFIHTLAGQVSDLTKELHINVMITDIFTDRNGDFWITTDGEGLYHVFESRYTRYGNNNEFKTPYITALRPGTDGTLYIGTKNGIYALRNGQVKPLYRNYIVQSFFYDPDNVLFARSKYSADRIRISGTAAAPASAPTAYYVFTTHFILKSGVQNDFMSYDVIHRQSGKSVTGNLALQYIFPVNDLCEDVAGDIWLGVDTGLFVLDHKKNELKSLAPELPASTCINRLIPDSAGGLWVASRTGLFYLRHNRIARQYDDGNGLYSSCINTILLHKDHLWIGTQSGLSVLDCRSNELVTLKKNDGLIANDVTVLCLCPGNKIAVGSSKGLTLIDAGQPTALLQKSNLIIEHIYINNKAVSATRPLTADYQKQVRFSYNVISFIYPELSRFRYRLSPDDPWIETQNKSLVLSNLEPGNYELALQARTYNSTWCTPRTFMLTIKKPWWATTSFYLLTTGMTGLCILLLIRFRERRYKQKMVLRQQFSELKLKALQTQLNPHFISNTLNAIQLLSLKNDEIATSNALTQFAQLTRYLMESSRSRFITLKDELQILSLYLSLEKLRFYDRFTYTITIEDHIDTLQELVPGVLLQPFVENSINHGIARMPYSSAGVVSVNIRKQQDILHIEITDNGIGRQKAGALKPEQGNRYQFRSSAIMQELSEAVNELPGCYIHIETTDILDNTGLVSGTRVLIRCNIQHTYTTRHENSNY